MVYAVIFAHSPCLSAQPSVSCECLWQGSFADAYTSADVVVIGRVTSVKGNSADIHINRTVIDSGKLIQPYTQDIRMWGNNGKLCRPDIAGFKADSEWVLALNFIDKVPEGGFNPSTPSLSYGRQGDFYLSQCGANWLSLKDDFVSGNLVDGPRWSWSGDTGNPVLLDLLLAYLRGSLPKQALKEAGKPPAELQQLMQRTQQFLRQQD